jgi:site-specific DNA-methyltransferase (adenine-specific)
VTRFDLRLGIAWTAWGNLQAKSIDLVVTSPPYNLSIRYGKFADNAERSSYLDWCENWAREIRRLLRPAGSLFLNLGAAPSNPLLPHELDPAFAKVLRPPEHDPLDQVDQFA